MSICKDCIHYEICDEYVSPNESFPEVEGGCKCFKASADVVEVRHGYWKDRYENKYANHYYECFVCGGAALDGIKNNGLGNPESIQVLSDFCPHCGAKMDGERREG